MPKKSKIWPDGSKKCGRCKKRTARKFFAKSRRTATGLQSYCKKCRSEQHQLLYRDTHREYNKKRNIELHSITKLEYDSAAKKQNNRCGLCKRKSKRLSIDHKHSCINSRNHRRQGKTKYGCRNCIRGLVCVSCNRVVIPVLEKFVPTHPYLKQRLFQAKGPKKQ